jgi:hypothetical protein
MFLNELNHKFKKRRSLILSSSLGKLTLTGSGLTFIYHLFLNTLVQF